MTTQEKAQIPQSHHFLEPHGVGEKALSLQADNCIGQNKNNIFMQYLMWTGRSDSVEISFMMVGHTKFGPDRFVGLVKKEFKVTFVSTLVRKSMLTGQNIPQLTKTQSGNRLVSFYDWKSFKWLWEKRLFFWTNRSCLKNITRVTSYHHFRFNKPSPGTVVVRELADYLLQQNVIGFEKRALIARV